MTFEIKELRDELKTYFDITDMFRLWSSEQVLSYEFDPENSEQGSLDRLFCGPRFKILVYYNHHLGEARVLEIHSNPYIDTTREMNEKIIADDYRSMFKKEQGLEGPLDEHNETLFQIWRSR